LQQEPGDEGAHHVKSAMGEVDDAQEAEDDGEPEAQHGVEGAVDQPQHELAEQRLHRHAEQCRHVRSFAGVPLSRLRERVGVRAVPCNE
jgi:hypothetical protein